MQELKWRRASHAGSAALNTAHSTVVDDADQKLIERLEHELCIVGVLETAVHCCACFHKEEGAVSLRAKAVCLVVSCKYSVCSQK